MEFELGHTYSGYKFLDVLRRSRSAVQYRVQNTFAQRVESLRTLTGAAGDDPDAAERFLREVRIRARLSHPHIVTFYTAVPIEGRMAMTTELPDSLSLAERLQLGPLPWREALDITRQLLEALACIHQQAFVHCDITPENILFGPGGFCKLADFSLARPLDPAHNSESGAVVGNPRYISPEQVKGERHLDQRSDLYSLGVVLYEMLCGRPPFESRSQFELMMAHVNQVPAPPSTLQAKVPQFLDAVVLKALAKDAGDRYPSAAAFADAIAHDAGGESVEPWSPAAGDAAVVSSAPASMPPQPAPAAAEAAAVPEAVTVPATEAAPEAAAVMAIVPELAVSTEPAPAIADAAAVPEAVTVPTPEVAPEAAPASAVVRELAVSTEPALVTAHVDVLPEAVIVSATAATAAALPPAVVLELAASTDPALAIADAEVLPEAVIVPTTAAALPPVVVPELAVSTEPASEAAPELALADALAAPVAVTAPAPEAAPEPAPPLADVAAAPKAVTVPTPESAPPAAVVMAEAVAAPSPVIVPEPAPIIEAVAGPSPAIVPELEAAPQPAPAIADAAVSAAAPQPATAVAPPDALHKSLWAAAEMVAEAASVHAAPPSLAAPAAPLPLASLPPDPVPVPQLAPKQAPAPEPQAKAIPALMTNLRHAPDSLQWFVFGGTAAFLGIIWAAIWLAGGK